MMIDLRSDTFSKPTKGMLEAMGKAKVGDDVFGEDPTVNELEHRAAAMFGMEAALYSPSGTMSNQIAIKAHTQPGDEVICEFTSHVYQYEGGGIAFNSGASVQLLQGHLGKITAEQVQAMMLAPRRFAPAPRGGARPSRSTKWAPSWPMERPSAGRT